MFITDAIVRPDLWPAYANLYTEKRRSPKESNRKDFMSLERADPKLQNFFIFNSKFGLKEGHEHEKLLYYYPRTDSIDLQVRNVGLAEAITRFTSTFNKTEDCDSLHTQKTHQMFYQAEPNIWMVMTVAVGWIRRQKESGFYREYLSESVHEKVLKAHLHDAYRNFKFLNVPFTSVLEKDGREALTETLQNFFDEYLLRNNVSQGDILTVWCGVSFLPLDKQSFLRVHSVLSLLQAAFPSIVHTAFLYRSNFAWCGFSMEDFQALSHFVVLKLSQNSLDFTSSSSSQSTSSSGSSQSSRKPSYNARFVGEGPTPSHLVFIQNEEGVVSPHHLVMYVLAGVTVCLSFAAEEKLSPTLFDKIARLLDGRISQLASDIGEQSGKKNQNETFRYIYHNHMNLATKSSIRGSQTLPFETMQTIVDMHGDLLREKSGELTVKTASDFWVVGRSSNGRESYIIVSHKNANLVEITDEVNRMCGSQFSSIFMED